MSMLTYFFIQFPIRVRRLILHLLFPFYKKNTNSFPPSNFREWVIDSGIYLMDIIAIPEIYELTVTLVKWNTRKLNEDELLLAKSIFGNHIQYPLVKIDNNAQIGTKKIAIAYVSFNTINYIKPISKDIFVHEMTHIWQYQNFGSIYLVRAIKAQKSKEGYDYGGVEALYHSMLKGGKLLDFNFEQQADIVEDYYKCSKLSNISSMHLNIYSYFVNQIGEVRI